MKRRFCVTVCVLIVLWMSGTGAAQVPQLINYQGYLTDSGGDPLNGDLSMEFTIYNVATEGTPLWSETHPTVTVTDGYFTVLLGSVTPIPQSVFNGGDRYLCITVGGDAEMTPRKRLVSVGYAFYAATADSLAGFNTADYMQTVDGVPPTGGDVDLVAGSNVTITPDAGNHTITISASEGAGGDITAVNAGEGLTGGADTGDATLDVNVGTGLQIVSDAVQINQSTLDGLYVNEGQSNSVTTGMITPNVVSSIDGVSNDGGDVDLVEGSNVTITPDDGANTITISASGGGGGDITAVNAGTGLDGGGTSGDVTLHVEVPLQLSSSTDQVIKGTHSSGNYGYLGSSNQGVAGWSSSQSGVVGQSISTYGVVGLSSSSYGVYGYNSAYNNNGYLGGTSYGVYGSCSSGYGVYGRHSGSGNYGYIGTSSWGVYGRHSSSGNLGYLGSSAYGTYGRNPSSNNSGYLGSSTCGAYGEHNNNNHGYLGSSGYGVYGKHHSTGAYGYIGGSNIGVYGYSSGGNGVYGVSSSGRAGYFVGNVQITGTLSKGGGAFRIDHPLDPANKYLQHSFVESPDMMNIYNGNVILDANGEAAVELPEWFEALNRDFRYQLTAIGSPAPNLYIAEKISGNRFKIAGGTPGMEVSWQVTGIRQDAFANAHRIQVEVEKAGKERGKYLHPEALGMPESTGVDYEEVQKMKEEQERIEQENRRTEAEQQRMEREEGEGTK